MIPLKIFPIIFALAATLFPQITGLNFPSNGDSPVNIFVAMQYLNPQNNGLPFWGPSGAGATYIWKYMPRQQAGYYVTMWWSNNGSFLWDQGSSNTYYGGHPYPRGGGGSTTVHDWEVATDRGGDYIYTLAGYGVSKTVIKDAWYTQALVVDGANRTVRFYITLPSTANADIIEVSGLSSYGNINPPSPALTFGDSPWFADFYGNERLSGLLRHIKIFNKKLSQADILAEAASENLATSEGTANVWYMNINPTPSDITDKSGKGHHFAWANSNRASLWTGSTSAEQEPRPVSSPALRVWPNPFKSSATIVFPAPSSGRVSVFNLRGEWVDAFVADRESLTRGVSWNAKSLPAGVYLIRVETGRLKHTVKALLHR